MNDAHGSDLAALPERQPCHRDLPTQGIGGIVLGGDFQGLGIARSLGRRGLPVCVIDDEPSIARYSRYVTRSVRVPNMRDEQKTVEAMLDVGRRLNLKGWVLYPTRDETVAAISRYREALSEYFRVPTPSWSAVQWAWDKRNTYKLAGEAGIPIPKTWFPRTVEDLAEIDGAPPLVIKPAIKEHFIYATKAKAWRADSREELATRFQQASRLVAAGEVMVQDLIPGDSQQLVAYCAFFKEGTALATMMTRYRRQHPPQFGRSCTFAETIDLPALEELAQRFLRRIGYYGLVEMEFKFDPRDGQYKLLDVNARTWGYHNLGSAAGADFPYLLFADQLGTELEPSRARPGITWVRLLTDLPTGIMQIMRGQLGFATYLKSILRAHSEAVLSFDDLLPGLAEIALIPYLIYKRGF
jgi:D-aspartate ligase